MNYLLTVQIFDQKNVSEKDFQTLCGPLVSILDALSETLFRKHGTLRYYHPGELTDAQEKAPALRWILVFSLGKERHEALHRLLHILMPLISSQVPSCTLQWKIETLRL